MTTEIKEFEPADAGAVARLFQASDAGWPEGFVDNILFEPEDILKDIQEENNLAVFLAWADGKAVGFANLVPQPDDESAGYLGLLTSDPDYYGRGVGRDLIMSVIDRCIERGLKRLDLDTWPGNTRAVPLYKKTGFNWGPTGDELQNHMPLLLTHPLTKPYFEKTDWYSCLRRDLGLDLDETKRNGLLVFTYEWESGAGSLTAIFDQKTKKPVELRTPELLLSLETDGPELVRGKELGVRLRTENTGDRALSVVITATGDGPVKASHYGSAQVEPGATETISFPAGSVDNKSGEGSVKLNLLVNGDALEMATSLRVLAPVELALEPAAPPLWLSAPVRTTLNLRNRLPEPVDVDLVPAPSDGLTVSTPRATVHLEPGEATGVPVEGLALVSGAHRLALGATLRADGRIEAQPPVTAVLVAAGPGEVYAVRQDKETHLVSEHITLQAPHKGREHRLQDRRTGRVFVTQWLGVGPPFWPSRLTEQEFDVSVQSELGRATVTLRAELADVPGVHLERTLSLRGDGAVTATIGLSNLSAEQRDVQIRFNTTPVGGRWIGERVAYFPLEEGVVSGRGGQPAWTWAGAGSEPPLAARWVALDVGDWTVGVLWPEGMRTRASYENWTRVGLLGPELVLRPGEVWSSGEFALVPTRAGWREIERAWLHTSGGEPNRSAPLPATGARLVPSPLLALDEPVTARVEGRAYWPRSCDGEVEIDTDDGFAIEPVKLAFGGLCSSAATQQKEIIVRPSGAERRAGELIMDARFPHATGRFTAPVLRIGSAHGGVTVSEDIDGGEQVWRVENGWLSYAVRPSVLGALYTLRTPDGEMLLSSFPEPQPRHWEYPVYGGVLPALWESPASHRPDILGRLKGLRLETTPTERRGSQGVIWRGVKLGADLDHEALLGLRFEIEYLTVPDGNVLATLTTLRSMGPARRVEYSLGVSPCNEPETPMLVGPDRSGLTRGGMRGGVTLLGDRWVSVEYPTSGKNLLLVAAGGTGVQGYDMGPEGVTLTAPLETTVPAGGTVEACHYIVLADDRRQAELYSSLAELGGL